MIIKGSATAPDNSKNNYSITSTSADTKIQITQHNIPQSVTIISQQQIEDQQLQTLDKVIENTLGISKSQADSNHTLYYSHRFQINNYIVNSIPTYFKSH